MTLNDKVQVGETTTGTSTSTTWHCPYTQPKAEQGWECPRCGRINAPWVRQCDCSRNDKWDKWDITWNKDDCTKPWWYDYKITCNEAPIQTQIDSDTFKVHPDSTVYQVGGSDYKAGNTYVNVGGTQSNKVDPNVTAWNCTIPDIAVNDFTTYRTDIPKTYTTIANSISNLQKQLDELKETK